jgi:nicotinate-nucleotide adenylyltransferase
LTQGPRIGLLGGSFDPIHFGHLVMAEVARVEHRLDRVVFIPARTPPHKVGKVDLSGVQHRLAMTRLAVEGNAAFEVSEFEVDREAQPSYTIDTLRHFHGAYSPTAEVFFILGMDSFLEIRSWKDHDQFLEWAHLIVATRPGYDAERMGQDVPKAFLERLANGASTDAGGHVWLMEIPAIPTSSSELRRRCRSGAAIRYLVPDTVWVYIEEHGLYR